MSTEISIIICIILFSSFSIYCWGECCGEICLDNQHTIEREDPVVTPISNII